MNERAVLLNELAQELRPMSEGIEWFDSFGHEEQSEVLPSPDNPAPHF